MVQANTAGDSDLSSYLADLDSGGGVNLQSKESLNFEKIDFMNLSCKYFSLNIFHLLVK